MPRLLHLLKDPTDRTALDVLAQQARDPSITLEIVLVHDAAIATRFPEPLPGTVFRLAEGGKPGASGSPYPAIDHSRLLELIFSADTVVSW